MDLLEYAGGPFSYALQDAWKAAGCGAPCPRHPEQPLDDDWCGPECETCGWERKESLGCECRRTGICPECLAAGATAENGRTPKCSPGCSTLCPVCFDGD
jgi:hypothetical protein